MFLAALHMLPDSDVRDFRSYGDDDAFIERLLLGFGNHQSFGGSFRKGDPLHDDAVAARGR